MAINRIGAVAGLWTPMLIDSDAALERYLRDYPKVAYAASDPPGIDLGAWCALGDDATERSFAIAQTLGLPLVRLAQLRPEADAIALLKPEIARQLRAVPLRIRNGMVAVAMEDPSVGNVHDMLEFVSRERVIPLVAAPREIRDGIARHYDEVEDRDIARALGIDPEALDADTSAHEAQRLAKERPVVRIVHALIADAVARRASDIHLRPGEHGTDVLYRIDDELVPVRQLLRALHPPVVGRIKVLGEMNLAEHRKPQDGRTSFALDDGGSVDLRISVLRRCSAKASRCVCSIPAKACGIWISWVSASLTGGASAMR